MNLNTDLENRLDALGEALRSRPRLTDRVMSEVRRSIPDGSTEEGAGPALRSSHVPRAVRFAQSRPAQALRSSRRRWLAGLAAAVAVAAACGLLWQPGPSLAQMQNAVQSKPWVRLTTKGLPADSNARREIWLSYPRDVGAVVDAEEVRFTDLRLGTVTNYDSAKKQLVRFPAGNFDADAVQSIMNEINSIFRGEEPRGQQFGHNRIVGRKQRTVEEGGHKWREYEIELQHGDKVPNSTLTIRVDPETNMPATMKAASPKGPIEFAFDYPAEGPADIYALGVPRDTPIDDRVPKDDLKRVLDALAVGDRDLDNYFAASGRVYTSFDDHGAARGEEIDWQLAWRRGDKWRFAGYTRKDQPDPDQMPKDEAQLSAWWRKRLKEAPPIPTRVCDGERVYRFGDGRRPDASKQQTWSVERTLEPGWSGHDVGRGDGLIEAAAYPHLGTNPRMELRLDPTGADGPAGSVLVELLCDKGKEFELRNRHWLDPRHRYAQVKDQPSPDHDWSAYEDFRQSPRGIWYPTRAITTGGTERKAPEGKFRQVHTETRYFLDFSVDLPNELFMPQ